MESEANIRGVTSVAFGFLSTHFARLPRTCSVAVGLLLITSIALLEFSSSSQFAVNIFYLLPVMLVAWATGSTLCGFIVAVGAFLVEPIGAWLTDYRLHSLPVALWNGGMRLAVFCIVLVLMQRVRLLMGRLTEQAMADELTGLANLRALRETLAREIERARRFGRPLALAYLDIDALKQINDHSGHQAGDRVLISFAGVARATLRSIDAVARVGGDEFVILLPETGADAALPVVDRLRETFSREVWMKDVPVTCSIGLACFERPPASVDELLATADGLMYEAKGGGGDTVRLVEVASRVGPTQSGMVAFATDSRR